MAKIYGNYTLLRAGRTVEGLAALTGAPCQLIDLEVDYDSYNSLSMSNRLSAYDLIWAQLLSAREAAFLMGCSCGAGKREVDETMFQRVGLMSRHAYSILDVRQLDNWRQVFLLIITYRKNYFLDCYEFETLGEHLFG